ncbi:PAS domain-containing sensor histidine kinase [Pseudodesulfovibrio sp.]|nr:PAS domain-containing sensor histidine kinase [Pseudodesulfovibrio sp.]
MKKRADRQLDPAAEREKLIGLGKRSISKSYYPELKNRLDELEHFRALLDRVSDAILIADADTGRIVDISGATKTMLDCEADTLIGMEFKRLLPDHIARYSHSLFNNKSDTLSLETALHCPEGSDIEAIPVEMTLRIVELHEQRQAIIVARDISERKRNEEALRKSHDELEIRVRERTRELDRANQAKTEFLSIVSHELRTPLTSVIGFAKIIRKKLVETIFPVVEHKGNPKLCKEMSRVKKNIDIIASEGDRLTALINDVLDLAKLEAARVEYRMGPVSPAEFIRRAVESSTALFDETDLLLLTEVQPDLPEVLGDKDRLIQVMVNLFSNGVKFTEKGSITCHARQVGDHIRISVTDTGVGIPDTMRATIFDKFTQGVESLADRPKGTGLGLPICRHIVEGHCGHIWVESEAGKGSRFIFTIPILGTQECLPEEGSL